MFYDIFCWQLISVYSARQWKTCMFSVVYSAAVCSNASTGVVLRRLGVNLMAETFVWSRSLLCLSCDVYIMMIIVICYL